MNEAFLAKITIIKGFFHVTVNTFVAIFRDLDAELFSNGEFPLWSLREGARHACFRLLSDVDAGIGDSRPR